MNGKNKKTMKPTVKTKRGKVVKATILLCDDEPSMVLLPRKLRERAYWRAKFQSLPCTITYTPSQRTKKRT